MMFTNEVNIMNDKEKQQNHRTTMKQLIETFCMNWQQINVKSA